MNDTTNTGGAGINGSQIAPQGELSNNYNPNAAAGTAGSLAPDLANHPVTQTQSASDINNQISGNTSGVVFPQAPGAPTKGISNNAGVPNPVPTAADIIGQGTESTPAEKTNTTLLQKVADLIGNRTGQKTLTNTAEGAAGVPALAKVKNDLASQIMGLVDQSNQLQVNTGPGGTIENNKIGNAKSVGVFDATRMSEDDLRQNQVQQATIAAKALTLKSAYYAASDNYAAAKDAADKAADAQYEQDQNKIDYMNALIAANAPSMTKQEKAQADLVTANLADRQRALDYKKEDYVSGIGLINAAMKNYSSDPQAQLAIHQAQNLDKDDPQYLQKVGALLSKYQSDPLAIEKNLLDIQQSRLNLGLDPNTGKPGTGGSGAIPSNLQPYYKTSYDGTPYVDLSSLSPAQKNQYAQIASRSGIKPILTSEDADKISHIAVAKGNLSDIMDAFNSVPVEKGGIPAAQGISNSIKNFFGDSTIRAYQNYRTSAINTLQALAGGQGSGFRVTQSEIQAAIADIPVLTGPSADTPASAQKKIDNLNSQIDKWQTQILGGGNHPASVSEPADRSKGAKWQRSDGIYVSDGTQWVKQ